MEMCRKTLQWHSLPFLPSSHLLTASSQVKTKMLMAFILLKHLSSSNHPIKLILLNHLSSFVSLPSIGGTMRQAHTGGEGYLT
jgi:hypothetical protein